MYSENRFLLLCGDLGHFDSICCNNSSDLWQQSYGIGLRMGPTFCPSLSMLTSRLLPNYSWGKELQCWAVASYCSHTFNNHRRMRNWEWVTAAPVLSSVNSWRAFWWWYSICSAFPTVKNIQSVQLVGFQSSWFFIRRYSHFPPIFFRFQWRVCSDFFRESQVDSKQSLLFLLWSWP